MKINTIPLKIVVSIIMIITVMLSIIFGIGIWDIFHKPDILFIKITYAVFVVLWGIFPMMYHAAMITKVYATIPIALVFIFSPLILSTFSAVIEQLLIRIIEIKSENDLTV